MGNLSEHVRISKLELWTTRIGILAAVLVGAGAVAFASVPHSFTTGDTLQAADLNANFDALDQRITALEAKAVPIQTVILQDVPAADTLDAANYSVYVGCPTNSRPIGGGCSLFQTNLSGDFEYNSQGRATGCLGAFASYASPSTTTSRMCLRTGTETVGGPIDDGNGSAPTVSSLGWKCSMGTPPANTSLRAYATCLQTE
jgi:hypothetical protein